MAKNANFKFWLWPVVAQLRYVSFAMNSRVFQNRLMMTKKYVQKKNSRSAPISRDQKFTTFLDLIMHLHLLGSQVFLFLGLQLVYYWFWCWRCLPGLQNVQLRQLQIYELWSVQRFIFYKKIFLFGEYDLIEIQIRVTYWIHFWLTPFSSGRTYHLNDPWSLSVFDGYSSNENS